MKKQQPDAKQISGLYAVIAVMTFVAGATSGSSFYNGLGIGIGLTLLAFAFYELFKKRLLCS